MRRARAPAVLIAILALVGLQLVRAAHVHPAGIEGRTTSVVHTHGVEVTSGNHTRTYASHGDHRLAIFLAPIYESVVRHSLNPPDHPALLPVTYRHDSTTHASRILPTRLDHAPPGVLGLAGDGRAPPAKELRTKN
jgi:hypothetical protein